MKNEILLRDVMDSLDLATLSVKIEDKYKKDVFRESIPKTFGELRSRLLINRDHPLFSDIWMKYINKESITCKTSGTTGVPKEVTHPFEFWEKHIRPQNETDVWGLCYDPTHIAGIFVILQAFVNNCNLVLLWGHVNPSEEIIENDITHLSASSTFYRMLNGVFPNVKKVTIGSMHPLEDLSVKFPNSKIRNIFATTEYGVIGVSSGESFNLKENMSVTDDNELLIDKLPTGDLVSVSGDTFIILGRKSQFANIGGEKVYFEYVETTILKNNPSISGIKVYSKPNSITGQILVADVVGNIDDINVYGLKKFEIPYIKKVEKIELTDNGKIKR